MIVVDTSVWIDFFRGKNSSQRRTLHELIEEEEDIALTEIILTEILRGIKEDRDYRKIKKFLLDFPVSRPQGIETYLKAAQIFRDCRKKGKTIRKTVDCIISAICIENHYILLHNDNDFDQIEACTALKCYKV
ncbi:pilus assembly protein [Candidatus Nitromaritima sp. SCGC AAA799-A02]|nr:pilus assembly protein [Candidatus Nitromaritima sp. SCGC AAA799-C22]KMP11350.1 pilus assembly protein [Candidatus Nitromaritima sp. SCGC AAA799-A02]